MATGKRDDSAEAVARRICQKRREMAVKLERDLNYVDISKMLPTKPSDVTVWRWENAESKPDEDNRDALAALYTKVLGYEVTSQWIRKGDGVVRKRS